MPPPLLTLTFDLLTLKSVWESHVTWGTPVQSFIFLGLLVFRVRADVRDIRQTDGGRGHNNHNRDYYAPAPYGGGGIIIITVSWNLI